MLEIIKKNIYKAFGLNILSEIPLPELMTIGNQIEDPDILIKIEDLSHLWSKLADHPYSFVVKEDFVMFQLPEVAIFSIQKGNKITVTPLKEANEDQIRLYILGTCMGALLMQKNILPLHGSAIAIDGKAYAIVGESGAGKSTLASAFLSQGYQLLSDDVIAVTVSEKGHTPYVIPSYPQQKLWQESLNQFGIENNHFRPIFQRETKFAVPVADKFSHDSLPLGGIFELVKGEREKIGLYRIEKLQRLNTLFRHTYRNFLIPGLNLVEWHFNYSTKIINKIDAFTLHRPTKGFTAYDLAFLILTSVNKEELINAKY
ncbi:aldolase [Bacillus sp. V3B]|uniref:aldolase n=1 Tax=Bacillus sp. V3B TaxID=2804915 RepID=UPI00210D4836|nr:aldolase [Bacillus sp. V3B]MCQ6275267.1 aldolase [Bacillus sp. V3B]